MPAEGGLADVSVLDALDLVLWREEQGLDPAILSDGGSGGEGAGKDPGKGGSSSGGGGGSGKNHSG